MSERIVVIKGIAYLHQETADREAIQFAIIMAVAMFVAGLVIGLAF